MAKLINLTINGTPVSVPAGTLVVDAAKKIGIDIPVFCYHPKMEPVGMCRQCLVEIGRPMVDRATGQPVLNEDGTPKLQFMPKLETACTNPVSEGMAVFTETEKAKKGQKEILELLLTSHPLDCPVCDKGGECPLQNLTMEHAADESRFIFDEKHHAEKHVPLGDLIFLDRERCIQCARCIRFQDKIAGEPVLGFYQRGRNTDIVTYGEPGFDSIFSGNTTDICPVGALTTADFRFGARPWELKQAASVCSQCPVGCNVTFNVRREAKAGGGYVIKRVMPRQNEQVNEIWMCDKGRFAGYQYTEAESRLKATPAELASALSRAAAKLAEAKSETVFLAGGRLANEDFFTLKQLAAALHAKTYLYTQMGGGEWTTAYGLTAGANLGDLGAGDTILVAASDLYNEAPLWHLRLKAAAERGATLIVANARATKLDEFASFVVRYAYGDEVETVKALPAKEKIGEALKNAKNLVIFYGADGLGLAGTSALAQACVDLLSIYPVNQLSDQPDNRSTGQPNSGLIGVWPTPNQQGALEMGFRPAENLAAELAGKTVYVIAADPAGDDPALAEALKAAKTVIVQDILATKTTKLAEIVLPAAAYTEREGTYTNAERRVQRFYPAVPAQPGMLADFALLAEVAKGCGIALEGRSPLLVMNQLAAAEAAFSGISYASLSESTEQWPLIGRSDLYYGGTSYENKLGLGVHLARAAAPARQTPRAQGLRPQEGELFAVPVTKLYDLGATVAPSKLLSAQIERSAVAALHPVTAEKLGLGSGDQVSVEINGAQFSFRAALDASISTGVVLIPRSMGLAISAPAPVKLRAVEKA
ncbi:MAG: NADH-quinone oxidoreductase subunit NuoG [Anaerolineales bacterium]